MNYDTYLDTLFSDLKIMLVRHDTGPAPNCPPAYIEAHIGSAVKPTSRGRLALDLGNYIYRRFGLRYQPVPEFRGKGKVTTVRWFMSWADLEPIRANVLKAFDTEHMLKVARFLPHEFQQLTIQDTSRGVRPQQRETA